MQLLLLVLLLGLSVVDSFQQPVIFRTYSRRIILKAIDWNGEVVAEAEDGRIKGCEITPISETEFTIKKSMVMRPTLVYLALLCIKR